MLQRERTFDTSQALGEGSRRENECQTNLYVEQFAVLQLSARFF